MQLDGKKVGVFGLGRTGLAALKFLSKKNCRLYAVNQGDVSQWYDSQLTQILDKDFCYEQSQAIDLFADCDLIILSPGIPRSHKSLSLALNKGVPIYSEIELAYRFIDSPIIAVTGTNGKTTTVSMLGELFSHAGIKTFIGGNIGTPVCEYLLDPFPVDYFILELSSFQLESMALFRPSIAVILNLTMSHGERYPDIETYAQAKFHIADEMQNSDTLIYFFEDDLVGGWALGTLARKHTLHRKKLRERLLEKKYPLGKFLLQGEHNLENLAVVIKIAEVLGIKREHVEMMMESFQGIEHRLEILDNHEYFFKIINDSKSTNIQSTLTALKAFNTSDIVLILGGQNRGSDESYKDHIQEIEETVHHCFLIGETTEQLSLDFKDKSKTTKCITIDKVIESLSKDFRGVLLFSPGFPSFDQFENYMDRGKKFKKLFQKSSE